MKENEVQNLLTVRILPQRTPDALLVSLQIIQTSVKGAYRSTNDSGNSPLSLEKFITRQGNFVDYLYFPGRPGAISFQSFIRSFKANLVSDFLDLHFPNGEACEIVVRFARHLSFFEEISWREWLGSAYRNGLQVEVREYVDGFAEMTLVCSKETRFDYKLSIASRMGVLIRTGLQVEGKLCILFVIARGKETCFSLRGGGMLVLVDLLVEGEWEFIMRKHCLGYSIPTINFSIGLSLE
ncbi:hypothetical protein BLNAU_22516 [Blattamonas nauphoetae]|uniref:Uncharacterized protein n=1 Tax=Blattamonas nauphoetae TaxID=2049346 RepID=A0ABQ9WSU0_9EUKA|nr:hypothetical protein BLNAU_22516 [Blattamonas nauphoetae]